MKEITLDATLENIDAVTDFVNAQLEEQDCSMKAQMQIDIAIDELFSNIARYAYAPNVGQATVRFEVEGSPKTAKIEFRDSGVPYDPLQKNDPDVTLAADDREIGGLGIYMVKKSMDDVKYEYKDNQNIVTIFKQIE